MMTSDNTYTRRRLDLIRKEPLFRQQSGELQKLGDLWASQEPDVNIKSYLRNIDLTVWDESENLLRSFSQDLEFAPYYVQAFLSQIADKGRIMNLEFQLPSMVAAFTVVRICAGGQEVRKKHNGLMKAIIHTQEIPATRYDFFNDCCTFFDLNKLDPATDKETLYRRGDPMERAKDTEEAKAEARFEELLGQILEATKGWNTKEVFGDYWEQWTELWVYLLKQEEMVEKISQKCPNSKSNFTKIHIRLVCKVAGFLKRHIDSLKPTSITNTCLAKNIENAWRTQSSHKVFEETDELTDEQANQIKGWLARNIQ